MPEGGSRPGHSLAFMSRVPVEHHEWHKPRGSRHAFLEVAIKGDGLRLFGVHLSAVHAAWTERRRERELQALLASIARHQQGLHALVGDFNTLAPGEPLEVGRLPPRLRPFVWLSGGRIRWRTIQAVLDGGYTDAYRSRHPDQPGMTFPTWDPHVRLDYVFLPNTFAHRLVSCEIVITPESQDASDHFPLLAEID
jgi:exodeoxyribonuclease-3